MMYQTALAKYSKPFQLADVTFPNHSSSLLLVLSREIRRASPPDCISNHKANGKKIFPDKAKVEMLLCVDAFRAAYN